MRVRAHLLRAARQPDGRDARCGRRATAMGEELAAREPGRGGHGGRPARQRHARRDRLRPRVGHPLRRGGGAQPLRRPQLHPARPDDAPAGHPAEVQPAARGASRASAWWWWTTRSSAATPREKIVAMLFDAGAAEVHMRISSPPILWPCFYGIDMADRPSSSPRGRTVDEIARADRRRQPGLPLARRAPARGGAPAEGFCRACFTGEYPIPMPDSSQKLRFEARGETTRRRPGRALGVRRTALRPAGQAVVGDRLPRRPRTRRTGGRWDGRRGPRRSSPSRTPITSGRAGSRLNRAPPQSRQKSLAQPPSGSQAPIRSSPDVIRRDPGAIEAFADAAVPVRRWQRVQWQ